MRSPGQSRCCMALLGHDQHWHADRPANGWAGTSRSSCGPANAAAQGLVCAWEKPPSQAQYAAIEREKSDTGTERASGFHFNTPAQCCCQRVDLAAAASGSGLQTRAAGSALATGSEKGDSSARATWNGTRCFPHAIIVGAQKGGTTALFTHFLLRPDFEAPRAKEVSRGPGPTPAGPPARPHWHGLQNPRSTHNR